MKLSTLHGKLIVCNSDQGYDRSQSSPVAIARRSARNKARRKMEKAGKVHKGDGKHINHKTPLSSGGGNSSKNLEVTDAKSNWAEGNAISSKRRKGNG